MKRTTVFLDERLLSQLHQVARADGRSFASIVREALRTFLATRNAATPGRLPSIAGSFASGLQDGAERVEELVGAGREN
jgi:metal-responsive CopG/Arc/MetJ family transcriptional regulator